VPPAVKVAAATANLDIFWLKDESLEDSAHLPIPTSSPLNGANGMSDIEHVAMGNRAGRRQRS